MRVAMITVHTSPLEQPGTGDAGGMNVYVLELSRALARRGTEVEIYTRATSSAQPKVVDAEPGIKVIHIPAGPYEGLDKNDLPGQLCAFAAGVLRAEAHRPADWYDVVHTHYWLSGQVGWLATERWDLPLVHSMHTMARVKNAALAPGDTPEPMGRVVGEEQVVAEADALVASTEQEAEDLVVRYAADRARVHVVPPGVDTRLFAPLEVTLGGRGGAGRRTVSCPVEDDEERAAVAEARRALRERLGLPSDRQVVLFAGRVQLLKGPDVLVRALGSWPPAPAPTTTTTPTAATGAGPSRPAVDQAVPRVAGQAGSPGRAARPLLVVLGGASGRATAVRELEALAWQEGVTGDVLMHPPVPQAELVDWFRAADLVAVPSHSESFGLVAAEALASGTPVVAAAVGGLRTVVADGESGVLVHGHEPTDWARVLHDLLADDRRRTRMARAAAASAARFSWDHAADEILAVYETARKHHAESGRMGA
ncbi:glycosyltransferase [Myceligenerans pegani]|uniref:D-inositol-3-phosphate glycosyltransferase n=1 Tax=Myceligenerans pegani TaxID=2776917 RepID=A0ABR9MUW1_9MICO|nr:glycosyltransferase [Myceligenerans sp. TRM 65318]MBE1875173.1 glycosyltransferase [Myceligenerans sp. TRM 65318]MBE3017444.1 glycosyltransferase [Myceligenerans sp. TRM 65318]